MFFVSRETGTHVSTTATQTTFYSPVSPRNDSYQSRVKIWIAFVVSHTRVLAPRRPTCCPQFNMLHLFQSESYSSQTSLSCCDKHWVASVHENDFLQGYCLNIWKLLSWKWPPTLTTLGANVHQICPFQHVSVHGTWHIVASLYSIVWWKKWTGVGRHVCEPSR